MLPGLSLVAALWTGIASPVSAQWLRPSRSTPCSSTVPSPRTWGWHARPPMPPPLGYAVNSWQEAQINEAEKDDFVIYLMEWQGTTNVGPYGRYHLEQIAERLPSVPFPVIIQPSQDDKLNFARRVALVTYLANKGIADAEQRVRIAYPQAEGLYGAEAPRAFQPIGGMNQGSGNSGGQGLGLGGAGGMSSGTFGGGSGLLR